MPEPDFMQRFLVPVRFEGQVEVFVPSVGPPPRARKLAEKIALARIAANLDKSGDGLALEVEDAACDAYGTEFGLDETVAEEDWNLCETRSVGGGWDLGSPAPARGELEELKARVAALEPKFLPAGQLPNAPGQWLWWRGNELLLADAEMWKGVLRVSHMGEDVRDNQRRIDEDDFFAPLPKYVYPKGPSDWGATQDPPAGFDQEINPLLAKHAEARNKAYGQAAWMDSVDAMLAETAERRKRETVKGEPTDDDAA